MPQIDEQTLKTQLKNHTLSGVYLLTGEEELTKKAAAKAIIAQAVQDGAKSFDFEQFDGESLDVDHLYEAYELMPMLSFKRCLYVVNFEIEALSKQSQEKLLEMLKEPIDTSVLVLQTPDKDITKNAKAKALVAAVGKAGSVVVFSKRTGADAVKFIQKKCKAQGVSISDDLCRMLYARCGEDMTQLANELDKLIYYRLGGQITGEDIERLTCEQLEASAFDVSRQILSLQFDGAMQKLSDLFATRQEPVAILGALSMSFCDLYKAYAVLKEGIPLGEGVRRLGYKKDFRLKNAMRQAGKFSRTYFAKCLEVLRSCDQKLKSSRVQGRIALEECVVELFLLTEKERR